MNTLRIDRAFAAPPERVWRALTDPGALVAWFWPARFGTTVELDVRPGGRYRIEAPRVGMAVVGEYVEVTEPHRLVFTWRWDGEDAETLVTVEITGTPAGCDLVLVHERFPDVGSRDSNAQGWSDCLDRLPAWLAAVDSAVT